MTKLTNNWRQLLAMFSAMLVILTSCQSSYKPAEKVEAPLPKKSDAASSTTTPKPAATGNTQTVETKTPTEPHSITNAEPPKDKATDTAANATTDTPTNNTVIFPPFIPSSVQNNSSPKVKNDPALSVQNTSPVQSNSNSASKIYSSLQAYAIQGQNYYVKNNISEEMLILGGKLYNNKGKQINAAFLDNNTTVDSPLPNFGCDVLLIRGSDLSQYEGTEVPTASNGLNVFTAIKLANSNKILLSSAQGFAGSISLDDYRKLLKSYDQNHGEIGSPVAGSEEYERLLNFLRVHEGIYGDYFIREMKTDQKYAVVTLSPQSNVLDIKQYILVNDNSFWEVAMSGLEKEYQLTTTVNQALPDFNLGLLPSFSIAASKNDLKADNSAVFKVMVYNGLIESADQVYYACGTTDYCYIVLYDNTKFLAIRSGQNWKIEQVPSSRVALTLLQEDGGQSAAFILLDNDKGEQ